jgi:hypothetical protein
MYRQRCACAACNTVPAAMTTQLLALLPLPAPSVDSAPQLVGSAECVTGACLNSDDSQGRRLLGAPSGPTICSYVPAKDDCSSAHFDYFGNPVVRGLASCAAVAPSRSLLRLTRTFAPRET